MKSAPVGKRAMEKLTRGLVAMMTPAGVYMSWRFLEDDADDVAFRVCRDGRCIATVKDCTNYTDPDGRAASVYTVSAVQRGSESAPEGMELPMLAANGTANGNFIDLQLTRPAPRASIRFHNPRQDLFDATGKYYYMPIPLEQMNRLQQVVRAYRGHTISKETYEGEVAAFKAYTDALGLDETGGPGPTLRQLGYDEAGRVPYRTDENGKPMWTLATYAVSDLSVGDLDGDGKYELIVRWDPSDACDSMFSYRTTAPCVVDAYKISESHADLLWRIDLGYNMKSGAHETQLLVYDFDGDGKAEVVLRTTDGATSGTVEDGVYRPVDFIGPCEAAFVEQYLKEGRTDLLRRYTPKILNTYAVVWEDPLYNNHAGEAGQDGYITSESYTGDPANQTWSKVYCFGLGVGPGSEYVTALDGETGRVLDSIPYQFSINEPMWGVNATCRRGADAAGLIAASDALHGKSDLAYLPQAFWCDPQNAVGNNARMFGDTTGNRSSRFLGAVSLLDGAHPCAVVCRGYYARTTLAAYRLTGAGAGRRLALDSVFDSAAYPNHADYECRGNHNLAVGDVDGDGRDEILYGSIAFRKSRTESGRLEVLYVTGVALPEGEQPPSDTVLDVRAGWNPDGTVKQGYRFTHLFHGDAIHLLPLDASNRPILFTPHEEWGDAAHGWAVEMDAHDAATGELLAASFTAADVGRAAAGNVNPLRPDHIVATSNISIDLHTGEQVEIGAGNNFLVYWTGSLVRQLMDQSITQVNRAGTGYETVMEFPGSDTINGTKRNPCLQADLFGDWREEVIRRVGSDTIRIYTTSMPTPYKLRTLMHDAQYRLGVANQNICYNQPPHPGFFLGYEAEPDGVAVLPGTSGSPAGSVIPNSRPILPQSGRA